MLTTSAGVSEVRVAEATLATIAVPQKKGKPKSRLPTAHRGQGVRQQDTAPVAAPAWNPPLHPAEAPPQELEAAPRPARKEVHRRVPAALAGRTHLRLARASAEAARPPRAQGSKLLYTCLHPSRAHGVRPMRPLIDGMRVFSDSSQSGESQRPTLASHQTNTSAARRESAYG